MENFAPNQVMTFRSLDYTMDARGDLVLSGWTSYQCEPTATQASKSAWGTDLGSAIRPEPTIEIDLVVSTSDLNIEPSDALELSLTSASTTPIAPLAIDAITVPATNGSTPGEQ